MKKITIILFALIVNFISLGQSVTITPNNLGEMIQMQAVQPYQNLDLQSNQFGGLQFRNRSNQSIYGGLWYRGSNRALNLSSSAGFTGLTYGVNNNLVGVGTYNPLAKLGIAANNAFSPHLALVGGSTEMRFTNDAGTNFWQIRTQNQFGSSDYFEIRKTNGFSSFTINGNGNIGIGLGSGQIDEKFHVSGNTKFEGTDPIIKLQAINTIPRQEIQFLNNSESIIGGLKNVFSGLQLYYGSGQGMIVNNTIGIGTNPNSQVALSVSGNSTFINGNTTLRVLSSGQELDIDGSSLQSKGKLFINNNTSNFVQIGSDNFLESESQQIQLNAYTQLGLNAPLIKTKEITHTLSSTLNSNSIPTGISDYKRILSVSCIIQNDDDDEGYLPGNSIATLSYDLIVRDNSILLSNVGNTLKGKKAVLFITYKK